jgi:predicted porin
LRNTFAGLQSPFGTVLLGKHDTPFKIAVRELDFFADTLADNRSLTRGGFFDNSWDLRAPDVAAYISPDFMGAKLLAAYVAGAEEYSNVIGLTPGNGNATKGDAYSVAGIYKNGPIYASLAYERHNFGTPGTGSVATPVGTINGANVSGKEEEAVRAGVGLELGPAKIGGMFQRSDDNLGGVCGRDENESCLAHNVWDLGASIAFGPSALKAQYTRTTATTLGDDKAWQWTVGLDHSLSKRTLVYALYTHLHNDNGSALSLTSSNSQADSDPLNPQGAGANPEGFSVGIRHKF